MSQSSRNDFDELAYNPSFSLHFLAPKYWSTWLLVLLAIPMALLPFKGRYWIADKIASRLTQKREGTVANAWVNLKLCFPEKSECERQNIIHQLLVTSGVFLMGFSLLSLRNKHWLKSQCDIKGIDNLTTILDSGKNVILLVPHTWAIDVPAILFASMGMPVSAMAKKQKNEVIDWLMHRQRVQYGGRVYERSGGVKPFIKSVRDGYLGYYLPDQDHGPEHSIFVDFFATQKATLPGLGKLAKVSRAEIVPIYAMIDSTTGKYVIHIDPGFQDFPSSSEEKDARTMNHYIETKASVNPEQYMWTLRLLRTQPDGKNHYRLERESEHK